MQAVDFGVISYDTDYDFGGFVFDPSVFRPINTAGVHVGSAWFGNSDDDVVSNDDDEFSWQAITKYRPEACTAALNACLEDIYVHKHLSLHGWRCATEPLPIDVNDEDVHRQFSIACDFLTSTHCRVSRSYNMEPADSSDGLRVAANARWQRLNGGDGYIHNGIMIAAMLHCGYVSAAGLRKQRGTAIFGRIELLHV